MSLPFVLDVAIGLIFIYLILSLLASEIQELITTLLQWRAKHLKDSIEVLLAGGTGTPEEDKVEELVHQLYSDPLLKNINQEAKGLIPIILRKVSAWLIPGNRKGAFGQNQGSGPSYIAPETFATSLLESLGIEALSAKLTEVRLRKFVTRIVGVYTLDENGTVQIPEDAELKDNWERGGIRTIAEKVGISQLNQNENFTLLVEEYADILKDFELSQATLDTCVKRMDVCLNGYIKNLKLIQLPNSNGSGAPLPAPTNSNPAAPVAPSENSSENSSGNPSEPGPGNPPENPINPTNCDPYARFVQRLESSKFAIFGENGERAVVSGGLKPSLFEIAELVNQTSNTYREVDEAYQKFVQEAKPEAIEDKVNPEVERQLLDHHIEVVEKQFVETYLSTFESQLAEDFPELFEHQLAKQAKKTGVPSGELRELTVKQRQRAIYQTLAKLRDGQQRLLMNSVLDKLTMEQHRQLTSDALRALDNEDRRLTLNTALANLIADGQLTNDDCKIYNTYQTYQEIQRVLSKLPQPVKDSFATLARRAQTRTQQTEHAINQLREEVGLWFDRSMSRASGVYKRNAKGVAIAIGLVIASLTNADAFYIADRLANDENLRQVVTQEATKISSKDNTAPVTTERLKQIKQDTDAVLKELSLPIGWKPSNLRQQFGCPPSNSNAQSSTPQTPPSGYSSGPLEWTALFGDCLSRQPAQPTSSTPASPSPEAKVSETQASGTAGSSTIASVLIPQQVLEIGIQHPLASLRVLLGWVITGIAISMGAPFWFDLLGKVVNVRNAGSKPHSADESAK